LGCDPVRSSEGVLTLPKRFKRDGLDLVLGDSVDPDPELCIEDLLETIDDCSFLFFRWPTVSLLGSTQDTSNIVTEFDEVRSAERKRTGAG
jgi:hypothetical protein